MSYGFPHGATRRGMIAGGLAAAVRATTEDTMANTTEHTNDQLKLQELVDREAIKAVRFHFAWALDTRDWPLFASLFTAEVDADLPTLGIPGGVISRDDLVARFRQPFRRPAAENPTQQLYGNFLIEVNGDEGTCRSYLVGHHYLPGFAGGEEVTLRARYDDRLVRTRDGWKIAAIAIHVFDVTGNPAIFA